MNPRSENGRKIENWPASWSIQKSSLRRAFFCYFSIARGGDPTIEISGSAPKFIKYCKLRGLSALGCTKYCKLRGLSSLGCTKYCKLRGLSSLGCTKYCKLRGLETWMAPGVQIKKSFRVQEKSRLKNLFFGHANSALINSCE